MSGSAGNDGRGLGAIGASLLCVLTLSGCADAFVGMSMPSLPKIDDINPFAEKQVPLPGKRVSVIQQENISSNLAAGDKPIAVAAARENDAWSQPGGIAEQRAGPPCVRAAAVKSAWSADAGTGSSFYGKLTASPIVYDGQGLHAGCRRQGLGVQHLGRRGRSGASRPRRRTRRTRKGSAAGWRRTAAASMPAPATATWWRSMPGPASKLWEKNLGSPVRTSPTAAGERVFVVTKEGQVFCLSGSDGTELWNFRGMPERASLLSNTSPAVDGDVVVVPYPSGDLVALRVSDGQPVVVGVAGAHAHGLVDVGDERHGAAGDRRRHRIRRRPCRPHGRHHAEDRRAAVVADGAEHPGALGRRRIRCSWSTPPVS